MSVLRFGVFEADLEAGELRKNGRKIRLQDQPFRVLAFLLQRPCQVVTREELRQHLWGDEVFVDFDHSLNMAVKKIREVLGDSATNPRFIETLPKRGYRFLVPVEGLPAAATPSQPAKRPNRNLWIVAAAALVAVVLGGVWLTVRRPEPPEEPMREVPLTTIRGWEMLPAISPDGTKVAFTFAINPWGEGENTDIYVQVVGAEESRRRLTDHPSDETAATWAPDGTKIAFFRRSPQRAIFEVAATGGPERKLADLPLMEGWAHHWRCLAWSPKEEFLATCHKESNEEPQRIFMLSRESGEMWPLTPPPSEQEPFVFECCPVFSPDGRTLAFARFRSGLGAGNIYLVEIAEDGTPRGQPRSILSRDQWIRGFDWAPDGRSLIFAGREAGTYSLFRAPVAGGEPAPLEVGMQGAYNPSISRQGNRLVFRARREVSDIWRAPGPLAGDAIKNTPGERWISSTRQDSGPDFSPDGTKIAFWSDRTGNGEIYVCDSDGSNEMRLTTAGGGSPQWSPDGNWIAYGWGRDRNIYVIPAEGGQPRQVTTGPEFDVLPTWSRDGRWIYYQSFRGKEGWWIYKAPFEGGAELRVTQNQATLALESWDGKTLYFSGKERVSPGIWNVPTAGGEEVRLMERYSRLCWAVLKDGICIVNPDSEPKTLDFYRFDTQRFETVGELPEGAGGKLAVSPDGRYVLYRVTEMLENDLMLVENFR